MLASYLGYLVLSLQDPRHQLSHLYYILPSIGISLGGQFFVFFQMFFAYTSDVSEEKRESADYKFRRFIIAEGSVYFGAVTGSYVGGLMYTKVGYTYVFLASVVLMIGGYFSLCIPWYARLSPTVQSNYSNNDELCSVHHLRLLQDGRPGEEGEGGEVEPGQFVSGDFHCCLQAEAGTREIPRTPGYPRLCLVRDSLSYR